jgi:hypothetical protein
VRAALAIRDWVRQQEQIAVWLAVSRGKALVMLARLGAG